MYSDAPDIEVLAKKIIDAKEDLWHIKMHDIKIGYLYSIVEKKQAGFKVMADITQVFNLLAHYCPYDFIVTVYEPNVTYMSDAQLQVLLYHELLHIGEDGKLRGHNIMDFKTILEQYGIDWTNDATIKPIVGGDKVEKGNKQRKTTTKRNDKGTKKQTSK